MKITLYQAPMSSASPVVWAMAELNIEHEDVRVDLKGSAHKAPEFLALNPMGQVPTLVVDGQAMFESSAITLFLGETFGVERGLWPAAGTPERLVAMTWTCWSAVTMGHTLKQIFADTPTWNPDGHDPARLEAATKRFGELMVILDAHLQGRSYITGDSFTLTDCYVAAAVGWGTHVVGFDLAATPDLAAYLQRSTTRPAAAKMNG